jgi:hypothetical protein
MSEPGVPSDFDDEALAIDRSVDAMLEEQGERLGPETGWFTCCYAQDPPHVELAGSEDEANGPDLSTEEGRILDKLNRLDVGI